MSRYPPPVSPTATIKQTIEPSQVWSHLSLEQQRQVCQQIITFVRQALLPWNIAVTMENSSNEQLDQSQNNHLPPE